MSQRLATKAEVRAAHQQPAGTLAWSVYWLVWVVLGVAGEIIALLSHDRQASLSQNVWAYVTGNAHPSYIPRSAAWAGRVVILLFFAWLGPHLAFGVMG